MINFVITLKWTLLVITLTRANADDTHGNERRATNADGAKKIVCYYTNWSVYRPGTAKFSPQNINPYLCTHLIYAFGGLDKENGLRPYDKYQDIEQGGYAKFTGLKTYNKNLKTMLAIGGWNEGSAKFSALVADEERRAIFVKNVVKFLRQNNFDGLDLDWEYPAFRDGSKPDDKENYASLVKELREEFERESSKTGRPRLLLTMAVPAGIEYIDKGYDVPELNKYLDFMNILSYDYHSAYEPNVNHHSPLYSLQEESEYNFDAQLTIDHTIKHYLKKGVDREKLVLGIPTYGRSYTLFNTDSTDLGSPADGPGEQGEATREKGYLAYYEICGNIENDKQWTVVQPKTSAMGPYAYRANQWVSYDDADIVKLKAKYVNEKGLGGIMYWSIDNDDFRGKCHGKPYPLIEAGKESLLAGSGSSANAIASSPEEKRPSKLSNKRNRPKAQTLSSTSTTTKRPLTTSTATTFNALSTPEPPTTPDPGTDFVCKEEGFFPHPRDCKKYFWCLDSGPSNLGIVAHQFTCPSGLMFNKAADSCDYSRNVICNKKSEKSSVTTTTAKTTSAIPSTTSKSGTKIPPRTTTSTTTTTTTESPLIEKDYEDAEDVDSQEDPKAIKQLITLIKKLGGIAELEKQLKLEDGSVEVTTPAISKTLYNKVFSSPVSQRNRNQYRNGPSSPQHEATSSNDDVPYYRKDKPQYVTIQRSRPLKNVPQDAEDSGTTNNKSVQPGKYEETADYEEEVTEEEPTTVKYSAPPRHRPSFSAESRSTTLRYVTLERNKSDRSSTTREDPRSESPSTTQRYVTLVRQRPSSPGEYEEVSTEASTQKSSPLSSTRTEPQTTAEAIKEKVSETETTTNLAVTSAQSNTDQVQTLTTLENLDTVTTTPKAFLVFSKQVVDASNQTDDAPTTVTAEPHRREGEDDDGTDMTTEAMAATTTTTDYVTEPPFVLSTSTSVVTTIRESPTEKTRIPLKRYREYLKNKTDLLYELRSNNIITENPKPIVDQTETPFNDSTTKKPTTLLRKHPIYTPPFAIDTTNKEPANNAHSRFFVRRQKNTSSTVTPSIESNTVESNTRLSLLKKGTKPLTSGSSERSSGDRNDVQTKTDKPRFRLNYRTSTTTETDVNSNSFARRRFSTTEKSNSIENDVTTGATKASRYFSRNRKSSLRTTEPNLSTTAETTSKNSYTRNNASGKTVTRSEILDSDENRYEIHTTPGSSESTTSISTEATTGDAIAPAFQATSNAPSTVADHLRSNSSFTTSSTSTERNVHHTTSTVPALVSNNNNNLMTSEVDPSQDEFVKSGAEVGDKNDDREAKTLKNEAKVRASGSRVSGEPPIKAFRNNSRFLKNPESEYATGAAKRTRIETHTTTKYSTDERSHRFGTPIRVAPTAPEQSTSSNRASQDERDQSIQASARRGRKKFSDSVHEATATVGFVRHDATTASTTANSRSNENRTRSRFRPTQLTTNSDAVAPTVRTGESSTRIRSNGIRFTTSIATTEANPTVLESLEKDFRIRSRPAVSTDSFENESKDRPRFYHPTNRTTTTTATADISKHEDSLSTLDKQLEPRRRPSKAQRFNVDDLSLTTTTPSNRGTNDVRTVSRNRGKIKAQNSLSKSEIRELASLANSQTEIKHRKSPRPIVEETFETNSDASISQYSTIGGGDNIDPSTLYTADPVNAASLILERSFEETTDTVYVLDGNSIENTERDIDENHPKNTAEIIGASETKYTNTRGKLNPATVPSDNTDTTEQNVAAILPMSGNDRATSEDHSEPPSRYRENFRRTTSPRSRSRSTTTTTTTEYTTSNESSRLANKFRRRKIKPDNRSTGSSSSRNENSYSSTLPAETSTTRPKSVDITQRGSTTISDFLPVPAPLYRGNSTSNSLDIQFNIDGVNTEDLEAQTINTRTNYYNAEDVSDLANPAVVAIHNLKTAPPVPSQVTYSKAISSLAPQIAYTEEISLRSFPKLKATPTPAVLPISSSRSSIRRGTLRLSSKTSTTTQLPSLQDIYNDYHETDVEYHADPVEIPITGKVRIHSDGYIECLDMGNFPHPFSCKKFISCAKMEYDSLLGWEYTCPKGLSFDPIGGICNWAAGLGCKE